MLNLDFNYDSEYHYLPELQCSSISSEESSQALGACAAVEESMHACRSILLFVFVMIICVDCDYKRKFAIIEFEKPVYCAEKSLIIGSRFDTDAYILHLSSYIF